MTHEIGISLNLPVPTMACNGHAIVFCPSWEYTGPYEQTVKGCCKTRVLHGRLASDTNSAGWCAWQQWLPAFLVPMVRGLDSLNELQGEGYLALMPNEVMRCKKYFDSLVVTPIDKTY